MKDKSKIQVVDNVTGNLTTFQEQDQSEKLTVVNETAGALSFCSFISCSIGAVLCIDNTIVELTSRKRPLKKSRLNLQSKTTLAIVFFFFFFFGFPSECCLY